MDAMSWGKKVPHSFLRSIICTSRALQSTAVVFELDPKSPNLIMPLTRTFTVL